MIAPGSGNNQGGNSQDKVRDRSNELNGDAAKIAEVGVLGHPALGVAWLANKLGQHGVALEAGHLVLAGSFTRVVFARKGDTLHADFGNLGGIAVQFV
jgi:2-keto-4-pentenoate hydratase